MKKNRTRFLSFLLSLVMIVTLVPTTAAAQPYTGTEYDVSSGEPDGILPSEPTEDIAPSETPEDSAPSGTPEDNWQTVPPESSTQPEIPEDNSQPAPPENNAPSGTPEEGIPSAPPSGIPEDGAQPGIPENAGGDPWAAGNYSLTVPPAISGYRLVSSAGELMEGGQYLIVGQGQRGTYALYPYVSGISPGSLATGEGNYGSHLAILSFDGSGYVSSVTAPGASQGIGDLAQLHMTITPSGNGTYAFASAANPSVCLRLIGADWFKENDAGQIAVSFREDGSVTIKNSASDGRYLALSESKGDYAFKTYGTDFWGPTNSIGAPIYIYAAEEPVEEFPVELGTNLPQMFTDDGNVHNSWVFTGGRVAQGQYQDIGGARSYAGHFEEYIRYTCKSGAYDAVSKELQRHVVNVAYAGQTLADIVGSFSERIARLNPRAVSYLMDSGESGNYGFEGNLMSLIEQSLALRGGSGMIVIQTLTDADKNAVDRVLDELTDEQKPNVMSVLYSAGVTYGTFDGAIDARGHLEMARQLAEAVIGTSFDGNWPYGQYGAISTDFPNKAAVNAAHEEYEENSVPTDVSQLVERSTDQALTWLFMGDSITHGSVWTNGYDSLAQLFEKFLKDDLGRGQDIVINTGSSGATTGTTLADLERRLEPYSPDVVVLMLGTNDAKSGVQETAFKNNLRGILSAVVNKGAIPVLRTPPPRTSNVNEAAPYAGWIREVAAEYENVILVDQYAEWTALTNWTSVFSANELHPDEAGHVWMAHQLIYELGLWDSGSNICSLEYEVKMKADLPDGYAAPPSGQPTEPFSQPQDTLSGTSSTGGPMDGNQTRSYFRIPSLVTLPNGWIVAASDIRWTNTEDSPNNLDTIVSISKDGGATWSWEAVNYFADFAPSQGPTYYGTYNGSSAWPAIKDSASFIDPSMVVDGSGTLWMLVDLQPTNVNLNQNAQKAGSGFDDNGYLMVGHIPESEYAGIVKGGNGLDAASSKVLAETYYEYRVDINGIYGQNTRTAQKDGKEVTLRPIFHRDNVNALTGYYVDAFFDLWYDYGAANGGLKPVWCKQKQIAQETPRGDQYVQANLFYIQSDWKAFSVTYLMLRSARVEGDGLVWSDPILINHNIKGDEERFLGVCPGRGVTVTLGDGRERIIFPVYENATGVERASTVYSDDGGKTWTRGSRVPQLEDTGKASESQIVKLPDGTLRMYSRNNMTWISYAESTDNGVSWGTSSFDLDLPYCGECMVSFINLEGSLIAPDGRRYDNLILASYPKEAYRSSGVIRIGSIGGDNVVTWLNDDTIRYTNRFNYSCLTQLREYNDSTDGQNRATDSFAVLYEKDDNDGSKGIMAMKFYKLTTEDLLGDGWSFVHEGEEVVPFVVELDAEGLVEVRGHKLLDMVKGGSKAIQVQTSAVYARNGGASVNWSSSNEAVATVDSSGTVSAHEAGTAVLTMTASNGTLTRKTTVEVVVQETEGQISTLPGKYGIDSITKRTVSASTVYRLATDGVLGEGGEYVVYSENGARLLFDGSSTSTTNQNMISGYALSSDGTEITGKKDGSPIEQQLVWKLVPVSGGYALQGTVSSKHVTMTAAGNQLALSNTPVSFEISHQSSGVYHVKCNGKYLAFSGSGWAMQDAPGNLRLFRKTLQPEGMIYTTHADGLRALLQDMGIAEEIYESTLAWEKDYETQSAAEEAQAKIDEAAKELYAMLLAGETIDAPESRPAVQQNDLYQVQVLCQGHRNNAEGCENHWWSTPVNGQWVNDFTVGSIERNTAYQPDTYSWRCPVTPGHSLSYYLDMLNAKVSGHTLVTEELPVAYFYYNNGTAEWEFIKNPQANPNCTVGNNNVYSLTIEAACNPAEEREWLTSMEETGYDRFTQEPVQLTGESGRKYLILAQSGKSGDTGVYALYLNPANKSANNAVADAGAGSCAVRLARKGSDIVGYVPGTEEEIPLEKLLMTVTSEGGKFYISDGTHHLNLESKIAGDRSPLTVTARVNTGGAYQILGSGTSIRSLTLFVLGQNSDNGNWHTDFWGPTADCGAFSASGSSYIYFYHPHVADGRAVTAFTSDGTEIPPADGVLTIPGGGYIKLDGVLSFTVPGAIKSVTIPVDYASTLQLEANGGFSSPRCTITMEDGTVTSGITRSGPAGSGVYFARTRENAVYFAGKGDIRDFSSRNTETPPWLNAIGDRFLRSAYIGEGITGVGSNAFKGSTLESITLPGGLRSIGGSAFEASRIRSIAIPSTVVSIGSSAFRGCMELSEISLPASVVSIGSGAFASCPRLRTVTVAGNIGSIPSNAFQALSGHGPLNLVLQGGVPGGAWAGYEGMSAFLHQNAAIVYLSAAPGADLTETAGNDAYFAVVPSGVNLPALSSGVLPVLPARNGQAFTGWRAGTTGEILPAPVDLMGAPVVGASQAGAVRTGGGRYPGGTVFTAVWGGDVVAPETVSVTFSVNGSVLTTVTVSKGESLGEQMPADPTLEGFTFLGWEDSQGSRFTSATAVEGDMELFAVWQENEEPSIPGTATVTFRVNGSVLTTVTVSKGESLGEQMPADPALEGFTFLGWEDSQGNRFTSATAVEGDMELAAVWQKNEEPSIPGTVTVTFHPNGGILNGASFITLSEGAYLPVNSLPGVTRAGYRLSGWYMEDGAAFQGAQIFHSMTLSAGWIAEETSGGIQFPPYFPTDTFTGPAVPAQPEKLEELEESGVPTAPTPFEGWLKTPENIEAAVAALPHRDVPKNSWYASSVAYVYSNGLMKGLSDVEFFPNATLNRGMMSQIIYNLARQPGSSAVSLFSDLGGRYYAEAVAWGASQGILMGYSDTEFGGEKDLTREQMAVMLYRYAVTLGLTRDVDQSVLAGFSDRGAISSWAVEALAWAVQNGMMQGRGNNVLDPQANITRAEAAAILERYGKAFFS